MTAAFTPQTRATALSRDQWCAGCGGHQALQLQHRRARGMGSTTRAASAGPANALTLCRACHAWAESWPGHAAVLGWRLEQREDPASVPVWRADPFGGAWSMLTDDGFVESVPDRLDAVTLAGVLSGLREG